MSESAVNLGKLIEVSVEDLQVGMYVSALDRPWLETPFLFQGFTVKDETDISELREHCKRVYVDEEQTDPAVDLQQLIAKQEEPESSPSADAAATIELAIHIPSKTAAPEKAHSVYQNIGDLRRELAQVDSEHEQATMLIKEVLDNLNDGGKLDVHTAKKAVQPIVESVMRNDSAMGWLVRMRQSSDYLYRHSISSAVWAAGLARHMGMPREAVETVGLGAMLLDVGKMKLPRELLVKPERLSAEEMAIARQHVEHGLQILDESSGLDGQIKVMVRTHHERHDGSGYPAGLVGQDIPVAGRIAGIVDFYDAVTSDRPYADGMSSYDCLRAMNKMAGKTFQREMVEQFVQSIGFFPPGTLVEMNDGSIAVVVAQNRRHRLKPEIMVVLDPAHEQCADFQLIDLQMQVKSQFTHQVLYIEKGLEPGSFGIDPAEYFLA